MAKNAPVVKLDNKPIALKEEMPVDVPAEIKKIEVDAPHVEIKAESISISSVADAMPEPPVVAPYRLRARQDTTFMKFDGKKLLYQDGYVRGQEVKGAQKILDILASKQANQFIKINVRAD